MIDVEKIKQEFLNYTANYNPENERIRAKIQHTLRVAKNCEKIANDLHLSPDNVNLAIAIGYFHDIGRFEQVRIANTFSDKESKINHSEMSIKVLFENNYIRKWIADSCYDEIIKISVRNHNKASIDIDFDHLSEKEILFTKIIRDADKLDIFYTITDLNRSMESIFWYTGWDTLEISPAILTCFETNHYVDYSQIHNNADVIPTYYAYVFDLYFPITLQLIVQHNYLDLFTQRICDTFLSPIVQEQSRKLLGDCQQYLASLER